MKESRGEGVVLKQSKETFTPVSVAGQMTALRVR